jgi:hypothetical protein
LLAFCSSLQVQLAPWKRVAFTRAFALGPAVAVAFGTGSDTSLFVNINEYLNVLQSLQAHTPTASSAPRHYHQPNLGPFASALALMIPCSIRLLAQLPFAMLPVLHFAASPSVMGRFASTRKLFAISAGLALMVSAHGSYSARPPSAYIDGPPSHAIQCTLLTDGVARCALQVMMINVSALRLQPGVGSKP